jgi:hypothetical protein
MSAKKATKTTAAKKPAARKTAKATAKAKKPKPERKMSALDAAAKVLVESGEPMATKQMVEAMATKNYWTSPAVPRRMRRFIRLCSVRSTRRGRIRDW